MDNKTKLLILGCDILYSLNSDYVSLMLSQLPNKDIKIKAFNKWKKEYEKIKDSR